MSLYQPILHSSLVDSCVQSILPLLTTYILFLFHIYLYLFEGFGTMLEILISAMQVLDVMSVVAALFLVSSKVYLQDTFHLFTEYLNDLGHCPYFL